MEINQYYDCVTFEVEENEYVFYFVDIIDYVCDYYKPDIIISDIDGLCDYICDLSDNNDILDLISLFKGIEDDIVEFNYILITNGLSCWRFNDLHDLSCIFNLSDIVQDIINRNLVEDYCEKLSGF